MHRLIMHCPKNKQVDHIDGNGLNNQKCNLRIVTQQQNGWNRGTSGKNRSGYKGVCWLKQNRKWLAKIVVNYDAKSLGYFNSKKDAARAYNIAAKKYFGEFAKLNKL